MTPLSHDQGEILYHPFQPECTAEAFVVAEKQRLQMKFIQDRREQEQQVE